MDNGPAKRKSPYKHHVKEHLRRNGKGIRKPVTDYDRGKGKQPYLRLRRSRVVGGGSNPAPNLSEVAYDVNIFYADYRSEHFSVDAKDYPGALMGGLEQRDTIEPPKIVRMRRSK